MPVEMTTQAQAPTEEMRERAREILRRKAYFNLGALHHESAVTEFAQALAAQDALAVERCAKLAEQRAKTESNERTHNALNALAAALRAQGEK